MILWKIISKKSQKEKALLRLIQTEIYKLRRRKFVWIMLLPALIMPFLAFLLFRYAWKPGYENPIQFYRWSAFGFTVFIILPVVLGILCTILMQEENQSDMCRQLWIVPIGKMEYFFSKFFIVLVYSICFMLITAAASVLLSVLPGYVPLEEDSIFFLIRKCVEIGILTAFAMLPVLTAAAIRKGYIFSACMTLVYAFSSFILMPINIYLHPICSMDAIVMGNKDIPGIIFVNGINVPLAFLCIAVWDAAAVLLAKVGMEKRL